LVILIQAILLKASLGPILISLLFFYRALSSLMNLQNSYNRFLELSGSLENLMQFQEEIQAAEESNGKQMIQNIKEGLQLINVGLQYGNICVLKQINFKIQVNESIAFVGESGSGKTSLVNILAGLLNPNEGKFFINGIDRNHINLNSYQSKIGYITQDPVIFTDTIFNNVTLWAEQNEDNLNRFYEVIQKAALTQYVAKQPDGFNTVLGSDGVNLSGGQKQRISIARELYKNINILIMDEATSSLDSETENIIQQNIEQLKGKLTLITIAHRLKTIKNVDKIFVLDKGEILDSGNYEELSSRSNVFKRMINYQKD
jgi:subfamily B ATP-binding cassette protein MsbA